MNIDKQKIIRMILILLAIVFVVGALRFVLNRNSMTLSEYDRLQNKTQTEQEKGSDEPF